MNELETNNDVVTDEPIEEEEKEQTVEPVNHEVTEVANDEIDEPNADEIGDAPPTIVKVLLLSL